MITVKVNTVSLTTITTVLSFDLFGKQPGNMQDHAQSKKKQPSVLKGKILNLNYNYYYY